MPIPGPRPGEGPGETAPKTGEDANRNKPGDTGAETTGKPAESTSADESRPDVNESEKGANEPGTVEDRTGGNNDLKKIVDRSGEHLEGNPATGASVSNERVAQGDPVIEAEKGTDHAHYTIGTARPEIGDRTKPLNLMDAALTQDMHRIGVQAAIGEGHEVDPRTGPTEGLLLVESQEGVKAVKVGEEFLAGFLHNPATDDRIYRRQRLPELIAGTIVRHNLSPEYWRDHSDKRAPKARRTERGFLLLEAGENPHDEDLYG